MKKLLTILFLLIPFTAFGGDITTFQGFGKLKIDIPSAPTNPADSKATYMIVTAIIPGDNTIKGDLYDANDNLVARGRVYAFSGEYKNIPFAGLDTGKQAYLAGQEPKETWEVPEIKLWMEDRQVKDEAGLVKVDDAFKYDEKANKEDLLGKISTTLKSLESNERWDDRRSTAE